MNKLNLIREKKIQQYENKLSKSKNKIKRVQTAITRKQVDLNIVSNISNIKEYPKSPKAEIPSSIIKVTREEAIKANKKLKNINYNKLSNKKTIKSAINTVCLAGEPNRSCREKILEIIEKCICENYVILFKANYGRFVNYT